MWPPGCRRGHVPTRSPAVHARLGLVPSRSATALGAAVYAVLVVGTWVLAPAALPWLVGLLATGAAVAGLVQAASGHRRSCWVRRTLRWWLAPVGTLIDPFDSG